MAILRSLRSRLVASFVSTCLGCVTALAQEPAVPPAADQAVPTPAVAPSAPADQTAAVCPVCGGTTVSDAKKAPAPSPAPSHKTCCCGQIVDWTKVPVSIRPYPRPGNFPTPPAGPGYFSLADHLTGNCRKQAPKSGYPSFALMPPSFYDADFRYVDSVPVEDRTLVEKLKRIQLNDCWMFSTGGQAWARFMNEHNSRLTESDHNYTLARTRAFGDLYYADLVRVYGEYIWADIYNEELPPLPVDVNRGDILNLFLDASLFDYDGSPVVLRSRTSGTVVRVTAADFYLGLGEHAAHV